ncbi:unnamed protein product [Ascophyllum nodosum]
MVMDPRDYVAISMAPLNLAEITAIVADPRAGATSTFSGTTRDNHFGKKVVRLEYEGYVPMAELELKKICSQIRSKWEVLGVALVHRLGVTAVEEASVIIAVSSVHRKDSLEAVQFAIDALKATVPIWKLEVYEGDGRVWKENAEWGAGGCCRTMVPVESHGSVEGDGVETAEPNAHGHHHHGHGGDSGGGGGVVRSALSNSHHSHGHVNVLANGHAHAHV